MSADVDGINFSAWSGRWWRQDRWGMVVGSATGLAKSTVQQLLGALESTDMVVQELQQEM